MSSKRYPKEFRMAAFRQITEGGYMRYQSRSVDLVSPQVAYTGLAKLGVSFSSIAAYA